MLTQRAAGDVGGSVSLNDVLIVTVVLKCCERRWWRIILIFTLLLSRYVWVPHPSRSLHSIFAIGFALFFCFPSFILLCLFSIVVDASRYIAAPISSCLLWYRNICLSADPFPLPNLFIALLSRFRLRLTRLRLSNGLYFVTYSVQFPGCVKSSIHAAGEPVASPWYFAGSSLPSRDL